MRNNYWSDCIQEMYVTQNIKGILLPRHNRHSFPSWPYLESECDYLAITNSLCSVKWTRKRCRSVLIDFWAVHDCSAHAGFTSQCTRHHNVFTGTLMTYSFAVLHATDNHFGTIATMRTIVIGRRSWSWYKSVNDLQRSTVRSGVWFLININRTVVLPKH
jgi:hypothetical protein